MVSPRAARELVAPSEPSAADARNFCILRTPPSKVSRLDPDNCAAYPSSDRASTETPVRWLMSSSWLPASLKAATAPRIGATTAEPSPNIDLPTVCTLAPNACSFRSAARSPRTSLVSSANSSTNARPARMACALPAISHHPTGRLRSTKTDLRIEMSARGGWRSVESVRIACLRSG